MTLIIQLNGECNPEELKNLFELVGWKNQDSNKLEEAFKYTWKWFTVRDNDDLIGFVRLLSDGIRHVYICNMAVSPKHQSKGVGKSLMKEAMSLLEESNLLPSLVATPGNYDFYRRYGFKTESNDFTAMCKR